MKMFPTKKEALKHLSENPLSCVGWNEGSTTMSAIYWNGKRSIQPADKKINWSKK